MEKMENKKQRHFAAAFLVAIVVLAISLVVADPVDIGQGPVDELVPVDENKDIVTEDSVITPPSSSSESVVPDQWNYYATYDFDQLEVNARVSAVRVVAHVDGTVVNVDTDNDDIAEFTFTLNEGQMWERDLPTGTHIWSAQELTVHQYDDLTYDFEQVILPAVRYWDNDYYYGGILSMGLGTDYMLITAAYDNTYVAIDVDNDGTPDQTNTLNSGQAWLLSIPATTLAGESLPSGDSVGYDTRAGAHIYTTKDSSFTNLGGNTIQVHAFAAMTAYFGSAYNIIPTTSLGKEYIFPRVDCLSPLYWDRADKMVFVATKPSTTINIDKDHDGVTDATVSLANPGDWDYWPHGSIDDAWSHGAHVSANEPIVAFYSSPGGGRGWDGFMCQMVPKLAARSDYWNSNGKGTIYLSGTSPYIHFFAYEDGTTLYRDTDNDGVADYTYNLNFNDGGQEILATGEGEHFWVDNPANHHVTMYQRIFYPASDAMSPISYQINPELADLRAVEYRWGDPAPGYSLADWPIFEGWMNVRMENIGDGDAFNVVATISSWPANNVIVDGDVTVGNIPAGGSAWSSDTFRIRTDTANPVDPNEGIFWRVEYDDSMGLHHVIENVPEFP